MTRKTYVPNPEMFKSYYVHQAQHGGGTLPAFHGARIQRGYGIGSFLGGLLRSAVPFLKEGAKAVGKTALRTGLNIASDVMEGKELKSSARTRAIEAKNNLQNKALDVARNALIGQTGKGIKRNASANEFIQPQTKKRKASAPAAKRKTTQPKKKQAKTTFDDIFG